MNTIINSLMSGGYEPDNDLDIVSDTELMIESDKKAWLEYNSYYMDIHTAIEKIFFSKSKEYSLYLCCLSCNEEFEEEVELATAWHVINKHGIKITDELINKKRVRKANKTPKPIRFIDRHFKAVELDDLPF